MSELLQKQQLFASLLPRLFGAIEEMGCASTVGECFRTDEQAIINAMGEHNRSDLAAYLEKEPRWHGLALAIRNNGKANGIILTLHSRRLAIDLNLFRNGLFLTDIEDYRPLGNKWKSFHPECAWGGDWGDSDHFSVMYQGRK